MAALTQDHVTAGVGALTLSDATTNVLQHFQHVDASTASSEAALIIAGGAVLYHAVSQLFALWRAWCAALPASVPAAPVQPAA